MICSLSMRMCVCVYICMYVYMCVRMYRSDGGEGVWGLRQRCAWRFVRQGFVWRVSEWSSSFLIHTSTSACTSLYKTYICLCVHFSRVTVTVSCGCLNVEARWMLLCGHLCVCVYVSSACMSCMCCWNSHSRCLCFVIVFEKIRDSHVFFTPKFVLICVVCVCV